MKETQLLKGVLDGCVLKLISQKEIYGYQLVQLMKSSGFHSIVGGTIYPLLQKLEKNGYIKGVLKSSPEGPDRKYFSLTPAGEIYLDSFSKQWYELVEKVNTIWQEEEQKNAEEQS